MEAASGASPNNFSENSLPSIKFIIRRHISQNNFPVLYPKLNIICEKIQEPITPRCIELIASSIFATVEEDLDFLDCVETFQFIYMLVKLFPDEIPFKIKQIVAKIILNFSLLDTNATNNSNLANAIELHLSSLFKNILEWKDAIIEVLKQHMLKSESYTQYDTGKRALLDLSKHQSEITFQAFKKDIILEILSNASEPRFILSEILDLLLNTELDQKNELPQIKAIILKQRPSLFLICEFFDHFLTDPTEPMFGFISQICFEIIESSDVYTCSEMIALLKVFNRWNEEQPTTCLYLKFEEIILRILSMEILSESENEFSFISQIKNEQLKTPEAIEESAFQYVRILEKVLRRASSEQKNDLESKCFLLLMSYLRYFDLAIEDNFRLMQMIVQSFQIEYTSFIRQQVLKQLLYVYTRWCQKENLFDMCKKFTLLFNIDDRWIVSWKHALEKFLSHPRYLRFYLTILIASLEQTSLRSQFSLLFVYINEYKEKIKLSLLLKIFHDIVDGVQIRSISELPTENQCQVLDLLCEICYIHKSSPKRVIRFYLGFLVFLEIEDKFYAYIEKTCLEHPQVDSELRKMHLECIPFLFKNQASMEIMTRLLNAFQGNGPPIEDDFYRLSIKRHAGGKIDYVGTADNIDILKKLLLENQENKLDLLRNVIHAFLVEISAIPSFRFNDFYSICTILTCYPYDRLHASNPSYLSISSLYKKKISFDAFLKTSIHARDSQPLSAEKKALDDCEVFFSQMHFGMKNCHIENHNSTRTHVFVLNLVKNCVDTLIRFFQESTKFPENKTYLLAFLSNCFDQLQKLSRNSTLYFKALIEIYRLNPYRDLMGEFASKLPFRIKKKINN